MSILLKNEPDTSLLEVEARGELTPQDYQQLGPKVQELAARYGRIRVYFDMVGHHGSEPSAGWADAEPEPAAHHAADISRIALVGDRSWEGAVSAFRRVFPRAEVRYFARPQAAAARAWINAPRRESMIGSLLRRH